MDIRVPRLGEGVSSGTVVSILAKEGDTVKKDQTVLELETEKAVAPIPSPESGVVGKILVKEGDVVAIGQAIMTLSVSGGSSSASAPAQPASPQPSAPQETVVHTTAPGPQTAQDYSYQSKSGVPPPASPEIRRIAKELGIDLTKVRGSERGGRIVMADLRAYIQRLKQKAQQPKAAGGAPVTPAAESIDFSKWGPVTKKPVTNLRKTIGQKMVESWTTIPHVTQFDEADITQILELRKKYASSYEKKKARLTVSSFLLKAVVVALKKHPIVNSSLDEVANEIVFKQYIHLGVAVDTEQGLIVPVIRDCDKKSILQLSLELAELAEKTRQRKISIEEIQGGTFNISNLGSIGGTFFTPIVTRPQVAVLGVGRGVVKPVLAASGEKKTKTAVPPQFEARTMLPLGLSYDHRVIDGADGARFIREIVGVLENFNEKDLKV